MRTIVAKFGGSSTANAGCLKHILEIVEANPNRRCVVLSAPGTDGGHGEKITEQLHLCWRQKARGLPVGGTVASIAGRFGEIAEALGVPGFAGIAAAEIETALADSLPHALSRGEYLCARLFSDYSGIPMIDAASVVAFDAGHRLDCEATARRFEAVSRAYDRVVIPGFYGADPDGRIVAFPRNGSDITGALAAAGMGAALYENWSDVPGLMTADPAIVPDARLIPQVGYRQMRQLARAGARVLHPACLDPVAMAGIPTRLRCTAQPDCFGTLIDERFERVVPCVAGKKVSSDAAIVTAFGLDRERQRKSVDALAPSHVETHRDWLQCTVPAERFEASVRRLHDLLPV